MLQEQLSFITGQILQSADIRAEVESIRQLSAFFSGLTSRLPGGAETSLAGGYALSPKEAADCIDERVRTARFLKGVHAAMLELQHRFPGQCINILYAGCGPFGSIVLPLLPLFDRGAIRVTFLDVHRESLESLRSVVEQTGIGDRVNGFVEADAITYRWDSSPLHMVVSETMLHALVREPQVSITANLAPQLAKNGILIPEEISISTARSFYVHEPHIDPAYEDVPVVKPGRPAEAEEADHLFSLSLGENFAQRFASREPFVSKWFQVPASFADNPDICLFTRVNIFGSQELGTGESTITNPFCVQSLYNLAEKNRYRLSYHFDSTPVWNVESE